MKKDYPKQETLDKERWLKSEIEDCDMSGLMPYCKFCEYASKHKTKFGNCYAPPIERIENKFCEKANKKFNKNK